MHVEVAAECLDAEVELLDLRVQPPDHLILSRQVGDPHAAVIEVHVADR
jgi:hypothetical protein